MAELSSLERADAPARVAALERFTAPARIAGGRENQVYSACFAGPNALGKPLAFSARERGAVGSLDALNSDLISIYLMDNQPAASCCTDDADL